MRIRRGRRKCNCRQAGTEGIQVLKNNKPSASRCGVGGTQQGQRPRVSVYMVYSKIRCTVKNEQKMGARNLLPQIKESASESALCSVDSRVPLRNCNKGIEPEED